MRNASKLVRGLAIELVAELGKSAGWDERGEYRLIGVVPVPAMLSFVTSVAKAASFEDGSRHESLECQLRLPTDCGVDVSAVGPIATGESRTIAGSAEIQS